MQFVRLCLVINSFFLLVIAGARGVARWYPVQEDDAARVAYAPDMMLVTRRGSEREIPVRVRGVHSHAFNPTATVLAFSGMLDGETGLFLVDVGRGLRYRVHGCDGVVRCIYPSWRPDGGAVAFTVPSGRPGIYLDTRVLDLQGGVQTLLEPEGDVRLDDRGRFMWADGG